MQLMPATDFKVLSLTAKNVLGTRTQSQPQVLEVNHKYSKSAISTPVVPPGKNIGRGRNDVITFDFCRVE